MTYETIVEEKIGAVTRITLNRPEVRNAQSVQLLRELDDAVARAGRDDAVRVVILAARGPSFSAGHDLKEAEGRASFTVERRWAFEEEVYLDYCLRIWDLPKPTIAQVQGHCLAAGFMVANMCDLIVASDDAVFGDPVVQRLAAAAVELLVHPWVLGHRKAKELLFTGEPITAQEAHMLGMVNRVVRREELEAETLRLAERIAQAPPFALRLVKRSINRALDLQGFRNALMAHFDTHQLTHATEEWRAVRERGLRSAIPRS
ncbi:MAG: enoyl-CoA hydratase [Clostridia bacterium]|nr:enoyl-CoA hydratase [Clostridia bacterium]